MRIGLSRVFVNGTMPYVRYATSVGPWTRVAEDLIPLKHLRCRQVELGVKHEPAVCNGLISAAIDSVMLETVIAIDVIDLGVPATPTYELLWRSRPDLILASLFDAQLGTDLQSSTGSVAARRSGDGIDRA